MDSFDHVLLNMLFRINGERTPASAFHILKGKASTQTIQDAAFFDLKDYFKASEVLTRGYFEERLQRLLNDQLIDLKTDRAAVTEKGQGLLHNQKSFIVKSLSGFSYQKIDRLFFRRLILIVQTLSHLNHSDSRFYPVIENDDIQNWVKNWLLDRNEEKTVLAGDLHKELAILLKNVPESAADRFVERFSGYKLNGKTLSQIAGIAKMSEVEQELEERAVLHTMISQVLQMPGNHPLCSGILDQHRETAITESAQKTLSYLNKGLDIDHIARSRHLTVSTIQDHIIELTMAGALNGIGQWADEATENSVLAAYQKTGSRRLKVLKDQLNDESISYFQIRLVLTMMNQGRVEVGKMA